jgi:uncharacterized protein YecT (DUF1311 family)
MTKLYKTKKHFITALAVLGTCICTLKGQRENLPEEKAYLNGQEQQIAKANNDLDRVYQKILAVLKSRLNAGEPIAKTVKDSLVQAERAWIQWRDAEALWRAYGGAEGGSALREEYNENLLKLINERKELLERSLKSIQQ